MDGQVRIERFEVWVVTDGKRDRRLTLNEMEAKAYADVINRHVEDDHTRLYVERRVAVVE